MGHGYLWGLGDLKIVVVGLLILWIILCIVVLRLSGKLGLYSLAVFSCMKVSRQSPAGSLKNIYSDFFMLKLLKERRGVHHSNFVILKNLKGGLK